MILLIIISILLMLLIGLLVLPTRLIIDSERNNYFIEIPIYFRAQLVPENQLFFLKIRLFFFTIKVRPFQNKKNKDKKNENTILKRSRTKSNDIFGLVPRVLNAFIVKRAYADIDTGDFPLNAQLIPMVMLLNNSNIQVQVNFENRNIIDIEILTKLYKLVWIGITNKLITSKK